MNRAHRRFLELAAASIDFNLSASERAELASHLASCPSCPRALSDLRSDARRIAALPTRELATARSAVVFGRLLRRQPDLASRRLVLIAAIVAMLLVSVAVAGSRLLERPETPALPPPTTSLPPRESPVPPSRPDTASQLRVQRLDPGSVGMIGVIAASEDGIVGIGAPSCTVSSDGPPARCWATIWTSRDGVDWTEIPSSDATEVGDVTAPGGPTPGIVDLAAGDGGFVGVGYAGRQDCTDALCAPVATVWTSPDGSDWTAWPGVLGETARPHAVAAFGSGWIAVGERFLPEGPRATVWLSGDGATWTAAADGPEFDVGGYLDTGEALQAGGMSDVAAGANGLVAAGKRCDSSGEDCHVAIWTTNDGGAWTPRGPTQAGALRTVLTGPEGYVALGLVCDDAACGADPARAGGFRSPDGVAWEPISMDVPFDNLGIRGGAGGSALLAIVETEAAARLPLFASTDGRSWTALAGPLELQGALAMGAAAATSLADGDILIVGWVETADANGYAPFAFRIVDAT